MHHGKAYLIQPKQIRRYVSNKKLMNELIQNSIVAILIPSRHKRGKKTQKKTKYPENVDFEMNPKNYSTYYKVFIHYNSIDEAKPYKQIKGKSQKMLHE